MRHCIHQQRSCSAGSRTFHGWVLAVRRHERRQEGAGLRFQLRDAVRKLACDGHLHRSVSQNQCDVMQARTRATCGTPSLSIFTAYTSSPLILNDPATAVIAWGQAGKQGVVGTGMSRWVRSNGRNDGSQCTNARSVWLCTPCM